MSNFLICLRRAYHGTEEIVGFHLHSTSYLQYNCTGGDHVIPNPGAGQGTGGSNSGVPE